MKTLDQALSIIRESKSFEFEDGEHGPTVLVIRNYYSGEALRLDLAYIDEEILEALQVEDYDEEEDYEQ